MSGRTRKIESQLKEIVGEEVATLSDPRIRGLVTVTGVLVTLAWADGTTVGSASSRTRSLSM